MCSGGLVDCDLGPLCLIKSLSISVSHGYSEANSLHGEKAPRDSMQSTKTEGSHNESGKPDAQGKFLSAAIKVS